MNEHDFMLLVEEYLDGTLPQAGRTALRAEVQGNAARRQQFELQARQHIRLHAQTSRVDFTESQHIAMMVVDIAEKHRDPNAFMDLLRRRTLRERAVDLIAGLRAEKGSPANRHARAQLMRLFGPMTVSVTVNVAAVLLVIFCVPFITPPTPKPEGVTVTVSSPDKLPDLDPKQDITPDDPTQAGERVIPFILPGVVSGPDVRPPHETPDPGPGPEHTDDIGPRGAVEGHKLTGGIPIPGGAILEGRSALARRTILSKIPCSGGTENAVIKSLQWLKANQAPDGSWAGQDKAAMSGLALLAYLAHGELPSSPEYGDTVTRALKGLLARQDAKGAFSANVYAHAIATYAVAEAFTLTRILELKSPMEKGVKVILEGQQGNGGFDYNYRKDQRFDTSVTGWQIQALKSARLAGADNTGLEEGLTRASRFLETDAFSHDGSGFVYEGKPGIPAASGGRASMTGVGTLCLQMLGRSSSPQVRSGLRTLQKAELDWPETGKASVYSGYYITQAKFQAGDKHDWPAWNKQMQQKLISHQKSDGHWEQGDYENGSHVYTTTLCTLMLEVYYRYLPTYAKRPEPAVADKSAPGDIAVDVR